MKYEKLTNYLLMNITKEEISKKEINLLINQYFEHEINEKTYRNIIGILKRNNVIMDKDADNYIRDTKHFYEYHVNSFENKTYDLIMKIYPNLQTLIWNTKVINEFTQHYTLHNYTIVETERYAVFLIVNLLKENLPKKYTIITQEILNHNREIYNTFEQLIVVKPLHVKSPIANKKNISIEKIMVDLYVDKIYVQYQGKELENIYEYIFQKYDINEKKLLKYAGYRTDIDKFKDFLNRLYIPDKYKIKEK